MICFLIILSTLLNVSSDKTMESGFKVASIQDSVITLNSTKAELLDHFKGIGSYKYEEVEIVVVKGYDEEYYFIKLSSPEHNAFLTRWLVNKNRDLMIDEIEKESWKHLNLYLECYGDEDCFPRVLLNASGIPTIACRDQLVCVSPEYAKEHPCSHAKIMVLE